MGKRSVAVALGAALLATNSAAAQEGRVVSATVTADAGSTGPASVSMTYELDIDSGIDRVPFTVLVFAPTRVDAITAVLAQESLQVSLTDTGPLRLAGEIHLPGPAPASELIAMRIGYRVDEAVRATEAEVRVVLPVVAVDWPPAEALPGVFTADITLPEGMTAREVFPTTAGSGAEDGVARASLQVVPAVVQVRARPEGNAAFSLPQALELLVLTIIVGLGVAGLRFLRAKR